MKISSYNISANASHSYSGTVDNVYTQKNKNECTDLSSNSSVEDLVSISNAAREQDGGYSWGEGEWEDHQHVEIKETSSLQQSNGSPRSSEVTSQKEADATAFRRNNLAKGIKHRINILRDFVPFRAFMPNKTSIKTEEAQIKEQTNVNMTADILSQDGRQINIDLDLNLQQDLFLQKGWVYTPEILDVSSKGQVHIKAPDPFAYCSPDTKIDVKDDSQNTL